MQPLDLPLEAVELLARVFTLEARRGRHREVHARRPRRHDHDGKGALDLFADTANATANLTHIIVVRMSHVDATHIDKVNRHQSLENFFAIGRGTDGEDDLCPSCSSWWIVSHSN